MRPIARWGPDPESPPPAPPAPKPARWTAGQPRYGNRPKRRFRSVPRIGQLVIGGVAALAMGLLAFSAAALSAKLTAATLDAARADRAGPFAGLILGPERDP